MNIDISKVNLLEKDIEDWLYENPGAIPSGVSWNQGRIERWIGRQYILPSGIADLVGLRENKRVVVVEVKNVPISKAAVLQVCRYQNDLKHIVGNRMDYPHKRDYNEPLIDMILIGASIDSQTLAEAKAVGIEVMTFSATVTLDISRIGWSREYNEQVIAQQDTISARSEWAIFGMTIEEDIEQASHSNVVLNGTEIKYDTTHD